MKKPMAGTNAESYASPSCLPKIQYPMIHARGHNAKTNSRAARIRLPEPALGACARVRCGRGSWPKEVIVGCSPRWPRPSSSKAGDRVDLRRLTADSCRVGDRFTPSGAARPLSAPPDGAVLRVVIADDSYL